MHIIKRMYESTVHGRTKGQALKTNEVTKYTYHRGYFHTIYFGTDATQSSKGFSIVSIVLY